jgi:hypothetical protein
MLRVKLLRMAASVLPIVVFLAVYAPLSGRGFISDDFGWIANSRVTSLSQIPELFERNTGFYRPIVAFTFAANYMASGMEPKAYGLTNLALALLCGALVYLLCRSFALPWGAAVFAGSLWLLNFHGINMAVLWISGRTSLLLTAAALASAICVVRRRIFTGSILLAIALFSKEEAVMLPAMLGAWIYLLSGRTSSSHRLRTLSYWLLCSTVALTAYWLLRNHSGAMTAATAPYYYRFTFDPMAVGRNVLNYADRAVTLPAIAVLIAWLLLRSGTTAETPGFRREIIGGGLIWMLGGYSITAFLPVRSSLYAIFPSVGACLVAAEIVRSLWSVASERSRLVAIGSAIALTAIAAPIHYSRTDRWVDLAELSSTALIDLSKIGGQVPDDQYVVVYDDMTRRANIRSAFGTLLNDAYHLRTGRHVRFWIDPPLSDAQLAGLQMPCPSCISQRVVLRGGSISVLDEPSKDER